MIKRDKIVFVRIVLRLVYELHFRSWVYKVYKKLVTKKPTARKLKFRFLQ